MPRCSLIRSAILIFVVYCVSFLGLYEGPYGSTVQGARDHMNLMPKASLSYAVSISSISPTSGQTGISVIVTGTDFGATQGTSTVTFNGTAAPVTSWSETSITVTVPANATTGPVVVTVGGAASNAITFTVQEVIYLYDNLGRLAAVVDPGGDAAVYRYDAVGNLLSISRRACRQRFPLLISPRKAQR